MRNWILFILTAAASLPAQQPGASPPQEILTVDKAVQEAPPQLAKIQVIDGASIIARRENRRQVTVRTNIRGRDQGGFVAEAQRRVAREIQLPAGYRTEWGGQFENLERARRRLSVILPLTIAIIFTILFLAFDSPLYAGIVLMSVPFSLVGGVLALYIRHINLSVSAVTDDRPITITVIDSEQKIREVLPLIRPMIPEGLVFLQELEVI
jgi:Cu/Ag efflux pump CusA